MINTLDTGVEISQLSAATPGLQSRLAFTEIPVVDFAPMRGADGNPKSVLARSVYRARTEVGFFYIESHGIAKDAIEQLFVTSRVFFAMPEESK